MSQSVHGFTNLRYATPLFRRAATVADGRRIAEIGGRILNMNGAQSDELNDVSLRWKSRVFSTPVNNLIKEILELGGEAELDRSFDQFRKEVEPALHQIRDRLMGVAMDRGLEI